MAANQNRFEEDELKDNAYHLVAALRAVADAHDQMKPYAVELLGTRTSLVEKRFAKNLRELSDGTTTKTLIDLANWIEGKYKTGDLTNPPENLSADLSPISPEDSLMIVAEESGDSASSVVDQVQNTPDRPLPGESVGHDDPLPDASGVECEDSPPASTAFVECVSDPAVLELPTFVEDLDDKFESTQLTTEPAAFDESIIAGLVHDALGEEMAECEKDNAETVLHIQNCEAVRQEAVRFYDQLSNSSEASIEILSQVPPLPEDVPDASRVLIESRLQSLALISKMIKRLEGRIVPIDLPLSWDMPAVRGTEQSLLTIATAAESAEVARTRIKEDLRSASLARYSLVTLPKEAGKKITKDLIDFVSRHLLPIVDSLDDGETYAKPLLEPEHGTSTNEFANIILGVYGSVRKEFLLALTTIGITVTNVSCGTLIDYESQEPFDSEPESTLPDETVLSVSRNGYQRQTESIPQRTIRMAQVIIVKNPRSAN